MEKCPFCDLTKIEIKAENEHWIAFFDKYPVTPLHTLLIPRTHRTDFFSLSANEHHGFVPFLIQVKEMILHVDSRITGFNIGMNCGKSAGQSIFHCHVHLMPRRVGDMKDPLGGVRGVIPEKQKYNAH